jgi:Big-like domain-containing protein
LNVRHLSSASLVALAVATLFVAACDDDPSNPAVNFALTGCPSGPQPVNANITLNFTQPVASATVTAGNVVVTNAITGLEVPGTLALSTDGTTITFRPSSPLPFQTQLRIRVQNLLSTNRSAPISVTLCTITTVPPPITQLFWDKLPGVSGSAIRGGSMFRADSGYVIVSTVPVFRRTGGGWRVVFDEPYFASGNDVAFVSANHGFTAHQDARGFRGAVLETKDGAVTFDTIFFIPRESINRIVFRQRGATDVAPFGVLGGGTTVNGRFLKYRPETGRIDSVANFTNTANVTDIDFFGSDTTNGFAVTGGTLFSDGTFTPGRVYQTTNGGGSWAEVAGGVAPQSAVNWGGVARRSNGTVYVVGGGSYVLRLTPGPGGFTVTRILQNAVTNPDTTNFQALQFSDVEFAPDNDNIGWIVGAQLVSSQGEPPRFQGLVFGTTDGGNTWTRQGVRGAQAFGAEFPRLNRIVAFSSTKVWLLGDGGTVLNFNP